ncbi:MULTISPECIES: DUF1822 family protein [Leptolyngbya]|uniref:DUF1822 family protein n=1 Tax=Leptolyngbya TaxID=47251 RepID=UPI00168670E8|nr:DUF1822 family protein [Leptolyngbya sp. FACHB-1624]MBD1858024.1 DUF1822 family protein [Leptolyngbya sp. FACHB-1624]
MSNWHNSLLDEFDLPDWDALNPAQIEVSPDQVQKAAQLSNTVRTRELRWQTYLSALGTLGFEQWLSERSPDLTTRFDQASIWQTGYPNLMSEACNIQVGAFKVCIIPVGSLIEDQIKVSIAAIDHPDFVAHFYVLVQVLDEEDQVAISGFLTYNHIQENINRLEASSDWTYSLPLDWFNLDANSLLLNLRCLEPTAIRLPILEPAQSTVALREKLVTLNLPNQTPWDVLTAEEGLTLLGDPILVQSIYSQPQQPSINTRLWLSNQIDAISQGLGWMLLPGTLALRSLREDFDSIRATLELQGVHIPTTARGAYRTLHTAQESFRLYAVTWIVSEQLSEWMLLIALGAEPEARMPANLRLSIRDETSLLFEQALDENAQSVLYAQVIGNWDEKFRVTITANQTDVFEIPPFGFEIDEST